MLYINFLWILLEFLKLYVEFIRFVFLKLVLMVWLISLKIKSLCSLYKIKSLF